VPKYRMPAQKSTDEFAVEIEGGDQAKPVDDFEVDIEEGDQA